LSAADYLQLLQAGNGLIANHMMNAVTIVFAYVAAAYFAASKLSRWQIISITFVYTIFLVLPASSALSSASQRLSLMQNFVVDYPDVAERFGYSAIPEGATSTFRLLLSLIFVLAWLVSVFFMLRMRGERGAESP
jgi:uncharacterized membrane protein YhdT